MTDENMSQPDADPALAGQVLDSMGMDSSKEEAGDQQAVNPEDVLKKRLGRQEKKHQREMQSLKDEVQAMREHVQSISQPSNNSAAMAANYGGGGDSDEDSRIRRAVTLALQAQEQSRQDQAKQAKAASFQQHAATELKKFSNELSQMGDKYDDFDDVVHGDDVPFTDSMRDTAAYILPENVRGEVLYKLGKNRDELKRLSALPPSEQAREMVKLAMSLMPGGPSKTPDSANVMNGIKANPATLPNSRSGIPSVSELRARLKER